MLGLGPVGDMCTRVARHRGVENIIGIDLVPERLERARARGTTTVDLREHGKELGDVVRGLTGGRGADAVIDAVGMEAHGSPGGKVAQQLVGLLPDAVAAPLMKTAGLDRLGALYSAIDVVRRGGTISLSGVYGGTADPMPLLTDDDPLGVDGFATHRLPLESAPQAYATFQKKQDGMVKTLLKPGAA